MGKHLLIVDDDPDILEYLGVLLGDQGYQVHRVESAQAAASALQTEAVDLVILDVLLQGRSGLDFLLQLRSDPCYAELPVILLTGDDRVLEDRGRSYLPQGSTRGADAVLGKPLLPEELFATLERLLDGQPTD